MFDFKNVLARATIAPNGVQINNAAGTLRGEIIFFQEDWKRSMVVLIALTGASAANANIQIDIRPNQDVSNACGNIGAAVFNPTGVSSSFFFLPLLPYR